MKKSHIVPAVLGTLGAGFAGYIIHKEFKKSKDFESSTENDLDEVNKMVDDVQSKLDQISELAKDL